MRISNTKSATERFARIGFILATFLLSGCSAGPPDELNATSGIEPMSVTNSGRVPRAHDWTMDLGSTPPKPPGKPVSTNSGLVYQDLVEGFGLSPSIDRMVLVHLTGYLPDGTKFESSRDKGMPLSITLGRHQTISGIEEGLMGMNVGGTRKLTIPPSLAYGDRGRGKVPPNFQRIQALIRLGYVSRCNLSS